MFASPTAIGAARVHNGGDSPSCARAMQIKHGQDRNKFMTIGSQPSHSARYLTIVSRIA